MPLDVKDYDLLKEIAGSLERIADSLDAIKDVIEAENREESDSEG